MSAVILSAVPVALFATSPPRNDSVGEPITRRQRNRGPMDSVVGLEIIASLK